MTELAQWGLLSKNHAYGRPLNILKCADSAKLCDSVIHITMNIFIVTEDTQAQLLFIIIIYIYEINLILCK